MFQAQQQLLSEGKLPGEAFTENGEGGEGEKGDLHN